MTEMEVVKLFHDIDSSCRGHIEIIRDHTHYTDKEIKERNLKDDYDLERLVFRIHQPFYFNDGDCFGLMIKRIDKKWCISDGGHLYFHLGIFVDDDLLVQEPCASYIERCCKMFDIEDRDGEMLLFVEDQNFGEAIYDYLQFCLRFMHVEILAEPEKYGLTKSKRKTNMTELEKEILNYLDEHPRARIEELCQVFSNYKEDVVKLTIDHLCVKKFITRLIAYEVFYKNK